jgi:hypothetical protein
MRFSKIEDDTNVLLSDALPCLDIQYWDDMTSYGRLTRARDNANSSGSRALSLTEIKFPVVEATMNNDVGGRRGIQTVTTERFHSAVMTLLEELDARVIVGTVVLLRFLAFIAKRRDWVMVMRVNRLPGPSKCH